MTEEEARDWLATRWGSQSIAKLEQFVRHVAEESARQNLVSAASLDQVWTRHIVDSAQLVLLAGTKAGPWIDVGTGGGFPGIVVAILRDEPILLVEPRKRRAEFLVQAMEQLALANVRVWAIRIEAVDVPASVLSARAVTRPAGLFSITNAVTTQDTLFLLPAGRDANAALSDAQQKWRGVFHVEQSVTDPSSNIIVATQVRAR